MEIKITNKLRDVFSEDIYKITKANDNEIYIDANPLKIQGICYLLNKEIGYPLVLLFANDEICLCKKYGIYYVFLDRDNGMFFIIKTLINPKEMTFISISEKIYAAAQYEKEIQDLFGLIPVGHPNPKDMIFHGNWPKGNYPLQKKSNKNFRPKFENNTIDFDKVESEGVYEIPVGPVHAGIIEPGHFRFSVAGEPIINLEAQLYFAHKGIEKMCEGETIEKCLYVSERISGDESFTNSFAYCQAIEKIAKINIPERAEYTRVVFAELERLNNHLGDLGGLCIDVGYGFAAYQFRMMRAWAYLIADELCGMRYLRGVNKLGGVKKDFILGKEKKVISELNRIKQEFKDTIEITRSNSLFIDRVENTGILDYKIARDLNAVGPGGRGSGIWYDVRKAFPSKGYKNLEIKVSKHDYGDVNSRMNVKIDECFQAIELMIKAIETMPSGKIIEPILNIEPHKFGFGITESPRGENIHWVMTGLNNTIYRYKVRTPSFCNWPALCHAVNGNLVTDFPLINKSFNLSYAGNDL
jgi:Ni,Fe-hydrogenase III large subunit/Ni,Fe-hydrogenase III component G